MRGHDGPRHFCRSLALAAGCASEPKTISVEAYLEDYPSAYCALQERCYPERFADLFNDDVDTCLEQARGPVERAMDEGTCEFDGEKAAACVEWAEGLDCESLGNRRRRYLCDTNHLWRLRGRHRHANESPALDILDGHRLRR